MIILQLKLKSTSIPKEIIHKIISIGLTAFEMKDWFKNQMIPNILKKRIHTLIFWNISDKKINFLDIQIISQIYKKLLPI